MNLFSINNVHYKDIISYTQIIIKKEITTFICGKSGSGKSTLFKLLNASISADNGEILYQGLPIMDYDTISLRREVVLASQNIFLFDDTIKGNFIKFHSYREQTPPNDAKILEYLKLCMADLPLDANCSELSGGERQRVFLSVCLSFRPKVLMLDEPTSALDEDTSHTLVRRLKEHCLENHMTLIVITHDKTLAQQHGDAIIYLNSEV